MDPRLGHISQKRVNATQQTRVWAVHIVFPVLNGDSIHLKHLSDVALEEMERQSPSLDMISNRS